MTLQVTTGKKTFSRATVSASMASMSTKRTLSRSPGHSKVSMRRIWIDSGWCLPEDFSNIETA